MEPEIVCSHRRLNPEKFNAEPIIIDLERSEYIETRKYFLKTLKTPKISEIQRSLSNDLAQVVFDNSAWELQELLGLIPPLEGAGEVLWTSPSDLLIAKVALTPPLTCKHINALTHQGILEIGAEVEKKYWNQMELEKEISIETQRMELMNCFQNELKKSLICLQIKLREECAQKIEILTKEFEIALIDELNKLEEKLRGEFALELEELQEQIREQEKFCEKAIEEEVRNTVEKMTTTFLKDFDLQHEVLCDYFGHELKKLEIKREFDLKMELVKCEERLKKMKHSLQCKNIANLMFVLCMERKKCNMEKVNIEKFYEEKLLKLQNVLLKKNTRIQEILREKKKRTAEVKLREKLILNILNQFQKFINFVLRACPTQAEFLLSVEKLLVFELSDAIEKSTYKSRPKSEQPLQGWKKSESTSSSSRSLSPRDFHDCYKEMDPPFKCQMVDFDYPNLPSFYYKKHLYVREDFRNMISQGIQIDSKNDLWSKEVEILFKTLRDSVTNVEENKFSEKTEKKIESAESTITNEKSNISFEKVKSPDDKRTVMGSTIIPCDSKLKKIHLKAHCDILDTIIFQKVGREEDTKSLLATRCSIEILKEKQSTNSKEDTTSVGLEMVEKDVINYLESTQLDELITYNDNDKESLQNNEIGDIDKKSTSQHPRVSITEYDSEAQQIIKNKESANKSRKSSLVKCPSKVPSQQAPEITFACSRVSAFKNLFLGF